MEMTMPHRIRRRIPRERTAVEPTPAQRAYWAFHHINLRRRVEAVLAGDHELALRLRREMLAYDDEHPR